MIDAPTLLGASESGALRVELSAGEMLYIPPYWAHAVASPEPSVAVSAFSTSWEQARWARSGWLAAPLGRFVAGGVCSKARGAALLITAFVQAAAAALPADADTPRAFLAHVYASRYAPLYGRLDAAAGGSSREHDASSSALAACLAAPPRSLPRDAPELDSALRTRLRGFAVAVAALLTQPDAAAGGRRYAGAVAAVLAADYVEEAAGWACGAEGAWRLLRALAMTAETDVEHELPAPEDGG